MHNFSGFINEYHDDFEGKDINLLKAVEQFFEAKGFKYPGAKMWDDNIIVIGMYEWTWKFYDSDYFEEIIEKWKFLNKLEEISFEQEVRKAGKKGDERYIEIKIDIEDMKELNDSLWKSIKAKNKFNL
jgi:hypothetical protein